MGQQSDFGEPLSKREQEVAEAYAAGASYKEIARDLGISPMTVRTYLSTIYRKLGVSSKLELADAMRREAELDTAFPRRPEKPSIAVLAFDNMSDDADHAYFSDGVTEEIITALSRSSWLFVIARSTTFTYSERSVDPRQIARELGVRFVLEGGVRRAGNRVRVTARLIDGDTGEHTWADRYEGLIEDVFDLQDEITRNVVSAIQTAVHLRTVEEPLERRKRPELSVWELSMRAWRLLYDFKQDSYIEAKALLGRALEIDPDSPLATMLLCIAYHHESDIGEAADRYAMAQAAYRAGRRATALDDSNEYAFWALGISCWPLRKHDEAIAALERAVEINPNCSLAYGSLGSAYAYAGRPNEAIACQEIAIRSNPKDPSIFYRYGGIALAHFVAGRFEDTIAWAERSIRRNPRWFLSHALLAASHIALNNKPMAQEAINVYLVEEPECSIERLELYPLRDQSKADEFRAQLVEAGLPK